MRKDIIPSTLNHEQKKIVEFTFAAVFSAIILVLFYCLLYTSDAADE